MVLSFAKTSSAVSIIDTQNNNHSEDSTVVQKDSLKTYKTEALYEKIRALFLRNRIYEQAFYSVFKNIQTYENKGVIIESTNPFKAYTGKVIRHINFVQLDVFGSSIEDSMSIQDTKQAKSIYNKFHINTSKKVLRNNLFFAENDTINPDLIARNAKVIRDLPFMQDAIIKVFQINSDSVDVTIVTKDRFPWDIVPIYLRADKWRFRLRNNNIGGIGSEFNNSYIIDNSQKEKVIISQLALNFNNIGGSFINSSLGYEASNESNSYFVQFNRPLIPYKVNWAGGLSIDLNQQIQNFLISDTLLQKTNTKRNYSDVWIARQFQINQHKDFIFDAPLWLIPSVRFSHLKYFERPAGTLTEFQFKNYYLFLGSIGLTSQTYYRLKYVNEFGKTEDIQQGLMAKLTGGYQIMENLERAYIGLSAAYRKKNRQNGLYYFSADFGSYLRNTSYSQGVLKAKASYLFPLIDLGKEKLRYLFWMDYTLGLGRIDGEVIFLKSQDAINRVILSDLYGTQKLIGHFEGNLFTSIQFYGFKVSTFGAVEFGYIGYNEGLFKRPMVSALSVGLRIRNDYLIFKTIQIRVTFYSDNLSKYVRSNFDVNEMNRLEFEDFSVGRPSVTSF